MVDVGVRIQNESDRLIGDLPNGRHDLPVKHGEIRIDQEDAIVPCKHRNVAAGACNHVHPAGDVANNDLDFRSLGWVRDFVIESAHVGDRPA